MNKRILTILLVSCFIQSCSMSTQFGISSSQNLINAHGVAEIVVAPDIATFSFTIREEQKDVKTAQQKMAIKAEKALALLRTNGIEDRDIKTSSYSANPKYDYIPGGCEKGICTPSKQVLSGYQASETFLVKIRNIAKAGEILTAISQLEIAEIGNLFFSVDDPVKLRSQAKAEAIAKAKEDAKATAVSLGVSLGKIVGFSEDEQSIIQNDFRFARVAGMKMEATAMAIPPIKSGEEKIVTRVTITYQIK